MEGVKIYAFGPLRCSVCVPKEMSREDVEDAVNKELPPLGYLRWRISEDKTFVSGHPNLCPCHDKPDSRVHYLCDCRMAAVGDDTQ